MIQNQLDHTSPDMIWVFPCMAESLQIYHQGKISFMIELMKITNKKKDSHQIHAVQIYRKYR